MKALVTGAANAIQRMLESACRGDAVPIFGDGRQVRDFTYVDGGVAALLPAATADATLPPVMNFSAGEPVELRDVVDLVSSLTEGEPRTDRRPAAAGDAGRTRGGNELAPSTLVWTPATRLETGLRAQRNPLLGSEQSPR